MLPHALDTVRTAICIEMVPRLSTAIAGRCVIQCGAMQASDVRLFIHARQWVCVCVVRGMPQQV